MWKCSGYLNVCTWLMVRVRRSGKIATHTDTCANLPYNGTHTQHTLTARRCPVSILCGRVCPSELKQTRERGGASSSATFQRGKWNGDVVKMKWKWCVFKKPCIIKEECNCETTVADLGSLKWNGTVKRKLPHSIYWILIVQLYFTLNTTGAQYKVMGVFTFCLCLCVCVWL